MFLASFLALSNGLLIGLNRSINSRLSLQLGAVGASLWNHAVGFLFLLALALGLSGSPLRQNWSQVPLPLFLGGAIGAVFVALNSSVLPRIGAMRTTLLIVAGEMLTGTLIDAWSGRIQSLGAAALGIGLLLVGLKLSDFSGNRRA